MNQTVLKAAIVALAGLALGEQSATAQTSMPDPIRFARWTVSDAKMIGRSAITRHALYVTAGIGGTLVLLSGQDTWLTENTVDVASGLSGSTRRILNEVGNVDIIRPMALMLFLGTLTSGNERLQDAAFTSLEAVVFANLVTNTLKLVVGRARPHHELGAASFKPFSGRTSFPSGHATTVFALTTPWLLYFVDVPSIVLFSLGAGTAFVRIADREHWFSDVLVGAAIGFGTGFMLTRRHQRVARGLDLSPVAGASGFGLSARLTL